MGDPGAVMAVIGLALFVLPHFFLVGRIRKVLAEELDVVKEEVGAVSSRGTATGSLTWSRPVPASSICSATITRRLRR